MTAPEIVTDPKVIAKLPDAGPTRIYWHWRWFKNFVGMYFGCYPKFGWKVMCLPKRMRFANAESFTFGPFERVRPMPWLSGPARSLHPEAFE